MVALHGSDVKIEKNQSGRLLSLRKLDVQVLCFGFWAPPTSNQQLQHVLKSTSNRTIDVCSSTLL